MRASLCGAKDNSRAVGLRRKLCCLMVAIVVSVAMVGAARAEEDLAALARQSRDKFAAISDSQLADAKANLARAARNVERFVGRGQKGRRWKEYLKWDGLEKTLDSKDAPDLPALVGVYRQLNTNQPGLESAPFRKLSSALQSYIDLAAAKTLSAEGYAAQLDALGAELEQYKANPTAPNDLTLAQRLDFLTGLNQSPELIAAVRKQYAQPNVFITISGSLVQDAVAKPIDRREVVPDCILEVNIRSNAHTVGKVEGRTVASENVAVVELISKGHIKSQNRGTKGPAVIRSSSETDYTASKRLELSDRAFVGHPTKVDAKLNSKIHSISKAGGGAGSRLVASQGWKRAGESKGRANAIATDHTKTRIRNRMDDESGEALEKARRRYDDDYRTPLVRVGALPEHIVFSSGDDAIAVEIAQANRAQLGAPEAPPALPTEYGAAVRIHESAVNNYAAAVLGGATAVDSKPGENPRIDQKLPGFIQEMLDNRQIKPAAEEGADAEPFKPSSVTFRRNRPITVAFTGGKVKLTVHLAKLTSGDETFTRWDVTGLFTPELKDGGVVLTRQGDLEVLPTDFNPEKDKLSSRQVALRSNLTKVLNERSAQGRGFSKTIEIKQWEPSGEFAKLGPMPLETFNSVGGWLTLAWNRK